MARTAAVLAVVAMAACGPAREELSSSGFPQSYGGGVAADEARAAAVGLAVLRGGGVAADAAVAMTFALAVTYPAGAGLGGGGSCIVYDARNASFAGLDFLPRAAPGAAVAVPGTVRGMQALHAAQGTLGWDEVIAPAEALARDGTEVSRALAAALAASETKVRADPRLAALYAPDGALLREGQTLRRIGLAALLAQVRFRGAEDFYSGQAARTLLAEFAADGLDATALRDARARWSVPEQMTVGDVTVFAVGGDVRGGIVAGQLWAMLADTPDGDAHWFAEASARAYADRGNPAEVGLSEFRARALIADATASRHTPVATARPLAAEPAQPGAAAFVVGDREGSVVACTLTMGRAFGGGRLGLISGITLAPPAVEGGLAELLTPLMAVRGDSGESLAVAATGIGAPAAAAQLLRGMAGGDANIGAPRLMHPGAPDEVWLEAAAPAAVANALAARGHAVRQVPALGRATVLSCRPPDDPRDGRRCAFAHDPRGHGASQVAR